MRNDLLGGRLTGRLAGLLAIAAALVMPASAQAHSVDGQRDQLAGVKPAESAGWHGRAVREPHDHAGAPQRIWASYRPAGWSSGTVTFGSGYKMEGGSQRVRETQRRLQRLGYRPGPVDGRFGPRTDAAVRWFQRKHGFKRDGVVGARTLAHLHYRSARTSQDARRSPGTDATTDVVAGERPREAAERQTSGTADGGPVEQVKEAPQVSGESEPATSVRAGYAALLAALAVALGLVARWALARRDRRHSGQRSTKLGRPRSDVIWTEAGQPGNLVRGTQEFVFVGESKDESIGQFRGRALATVRRDESREAAYLLLHDPSKSAPIWVAESEIRTFADEADGLHIDGDHAREGPLTQLPKRLMSADTKAIGRTGDDTAVSTRRP